MKFQSAFDPHCNALTIGENIDVMRHLLALGYKGRFHMIYLDGPFNSGLIFTNRNAEYGFEYVNPWIQLDTLQEYLNPQKYLDKYKLRIELAFELLRDDGVMVLQTNFQEGHHIKVLMDSVIGRENFLSEVIWKFSPSPWPNLWGSPIGYQHENILFYSKTEHHRKNVGDYLPSVWDDIAGYQYDDGEDMKFPSQKPERLIERILEATTKEGDWVGDFYCGSGTFPCVAERKGRSWFACDSSSMAISITQGRLARIDSHFKLYHLLDEFQSDVFINNEYTKTSRAPISAYELAGLEGYEGIARSSKRVRVNAFDFLPEVDLMNQDDRFEFNYIFPFITENGISETETILLARPKPVWDTEQCRLLLSNPFEWIFYHLVHLERNPWMMLNLNKRDHDYKHIFQWNESRRRTEEILNEIQHRWITESIEREDHILCKDVLGYRYMISKK